MRKDNAIAVTTIDLLRHGECEGGNIYRGSIDVALSANGEQQMQNALARWQQTRWQRIITSPLRRCHEFAQRQSAALKIPLCVQPAFRELHFGDWEGRVIDEVKQQEPDAVKAFYADPATVAPPNGESMLELQARMLPAWHQVLADHAGEHLLLIQHGVTIRVLLSWVLGLPLAESTRLDIPYASLSRVAIYHTPTELFPRLLFFNAHE